MARIRLQLSKDALRCDWRYAQRGEVCSASRMQGVGQARRHAGTGGTVWAAHSALLVPESHLRVRGGNTCPVVTYGTMRNLGERRGRRVIGDAPTLPSAARPDGVSSTRLSPRREPDEPCEMEGNNNTASHADVGRCPSSLLLCAACNDSTALCCHHAPQCCSHLECIDTCLSYNKGPVLSHALAGRVGQGDDELRMAAGPHLLGLSCF